MAKNTAVYSLSYIEKVPRSPNPQDCTQIAEAEQVQNPQLFGGHGVGIDGKPPGIFGRPVASDTVCPRQKILYVETLLVAESDRNLVQRIESPGVELRQFSLGGRVETKDFGLHRVLQQYRKTHEVEIHPPKMQFILTNCV